MIVLPALAALAGTASEGQAGPPQAHQTFSIRVPGRVEVKSAGPRADGTPATIRVTATERVDVVVERRSAASAKVVPVLRSRLTTAEDSFTFPAAENWFDTTENPRSTVIITIVPLW
jgi:hypothetical protein